jgi:hypothetical protein
MPEQPVVGPVFDTAAAASLLGVKPGTLEVWRCKGIGPRFVKIGARVVYRLRDLNEYLDSRTRSSTADPGPAAE